MADPFAALKAWLRESRGLFRLGVEEAAIRRAVSEKTLELDLQLNRAAFHRSGRVLMVRCVVTDAAGSTRSITASRQLEIPEFDLPS